MTKIIMNGCNGKMGQVITRLVSEDNECEIVAGFDVNDSIENTYPVFTNPDEFTGDADVIIDFSHPSALTTVLNYCKKRKLPVILATTGYTDDQKKVLSVRPGITDYASIEYVDENTILGKASDPDKAYIEQIMPDKIRYNMKYICNRSVKEYFKIIFLTFWSIIR